MTYSNDEESLVSGVNPGNRTESGITPLSQEKMPLLSEIVLSGLDFRLRPFRSNRHSKMLKNVAKMIALLF
jgi:hypothetical protein